MSNCRAPPVRLTRQPADLSARPWPALRSHHIDCLGACAESVAVVKELVSVFCEGDAIGDQALLSGKVRRHYLPLCVTGTDLSNCLADHD